MVSHAMYQLFPIFNSNTKNATLKSNPNSMLPAYYYPQNTLSQQAAV